MCLAQKLTLSEKIYNMGNFWSNNLGVPKFTLSKSKTKSNAIPVFNNLNCNESMNVTKKWTNKCNL